MRTESAATEEENDEEIRKAMERVLGESRDENADDELSEEEKQKLLDEVMPFSERTRENKSDREVNPRNLYLPKGVESVTKGRK